MRVVLDDTLVRDDPEKPLIDDKSLDSFSRTFALKLGKSTNATVIGLDLYDGVEQLHLGFVGLLAEAYNRHEKIRIAPHDLWFIVLTELAKIVNENSEACRPLFTNASEKIEILTQTDDPTKIDLEAVMVALNALVPTDVRAFLPELSTADDDVKLAMYATFADMVQSYYSYSTFMCGIPEIEVTGTFEDWQKLVTSCGALARLFMAVGLPRVTGYIIEVGDVLVKIGAHVGGVEPEPEFWKGIFTQKNIGSGGQLAINGWITKLFFTKHPVNKLENFTSTYGVIPYKNLESGRSFKAAHGSFYQLRDENGFIYAGYGKVVIETTQVNS